MAQKSTGFSEPVKLLICIAGIYVFYLWYGICQEELYKTYYGDTEKKKFTFSIFLLFIQTLMNAIAAFVVLVITRTPISTRTPFIQYSLQAASSSLATWCSFLALVHVDYPTQALAKSCKPIPVMLLGVFLLKRRYSWFKYAYVALITGGIAWFMLEDNQGRSRAAKEENLYGYALLLGSLILDGVTGTLQERLIHEYKPSSHHLMMNSNLWAAGLLGVVGFAAGEMGPAFEFCLKHPHASWDIFVLAVTSALGQNFIYYCISEFGSLNCSIITTSRKFFTILASCVWFGHTMTSQQQLAVLLVFTGLAADLYASKKTREARSAAHLHKMQTEKPTTIAPGHHHQHHRKHD